MLFVDNKLINLAALTTIESDRRKGEGERHRWCARFTDGSGTGFKATAEEIEVLAVRLIPAPADYFVLYVTDEKIFSEPVLAFGILPGDGNPPTPYTARGCSPLENNAGILCPDGQVVTAFEQFPTREAFAKAILQATHRGSKPDAA